MKSFDEILEYLNKRDDRGDYQIQSDQLDESIQVQFPQGIFIFIDVERYQIAFALDNRSSLSFLRMEQFLQQLQQAMELGNSLEKFLQSP